MFEASDRIVHANNPDAYSKQILTNSFLNNRRRQLHLQRLLPQIRAAGQHVTQDISDVQATPYELWRAGSARW